MDLYTQEKLDKYLELLNKIKEKVKNEQTAGILLSEIAKDKRREQVNQKGVFNGNAPATEKQKAYLNNLGAAVPEGLTRQQASTLIDNAKAEQQEMKNTMRMPVRIP